MSEEKPREEDRARLREAVVLARMGSGAVEPNPMVGALVVKDGRVVARGYHARYGGPHAEMRALARAGERARGATLYLTLEPCSTEGKTPPCTDRIVKAGIRKVVAGAVDPNPRHGGRGFALLQRAGLSVVHLEDRACKDLLLRFKTHLEAKRPYVILKWAMTLDGRIAAEDGSSQWISGEASRRAVHRLRGHVDGILVGSGTVRIDDPRLNCRLKDVPLKPVRIILDPELQTPVGARLVTGGAGGMEEGFPAGPVWILAGRDGDPAKAAALKRDGAEVLSIDAPGAVGLRFLETALAVLRDRGVYRLLVEGGSQVFTSLIEARMADQAIVYTAPKIVGGRGALSPVEGAGQRHMSEALPLTDVRIRRSGEDAEFLGFFKWHGAS